MEELFNRVAKWFRRHRLSTVYSILLAICAASILPIMVYFHGRVFPWWADGGTWLKQVNAILGVEYPMWGDRAFQLDQLYLLLLSSLRLSLGNSIIALETSAVLTYAIRVATTFILARKLFKSEIAGLAAALLSGLHPLFYETLGWGGYPNLLGYALLPLAFYSILVCIEKASARRIVLTGLIVAATAFSHNLTSLVMLGALSLWLILIVLVKVSSRRVDVMRHFGIVAYSVGVMVFVLVFELFVTGLPRYEFSEAAFYRLRIGLPDLLWAIKSSTVAFALIFLTVVSFVVIRFVRGEKLGALSPHIFAMASWVLAPLLMSQAYLLGVAFDYRRVFFFAVQASLILAVGPLAILSMTSLTRMAGAISRDISMAGFIRKASRALPATILILLSLSVLATEVGVGSSYLKVVNDWYTHIDLYGDREKLDALEWIRHNTPVDAVFVAEEPFARWIEGVASRRVLMYAPPQYLFVKGEADRSMAASTLLESRIELRNDLVRICDQDPYGNFTPSVSFKREGVYENTLYINNIESKVYVSNGTAEWFERFSEATTTRSYSLSSDLNSASYVASYSMNHVSYERQIKLEANAAEVSLTYSVKTADPSLRLLNFTIPLLSAEGKGFDEVLAESTEAIRVRSGAQWFHISLRGQVLGAVFVDTNATDTILLSFKPHQGSTESISAHINFGPDAQGSMSGKPIAINRDDVVREFMVSYVVIPRLSRPRPNGAIPLRLESLPAYNHLLQDPGLRVVYENSNVIVLHVVSLGLK